MKSPGKKIALSNWFLIQLVVYVNWKIGRMIWARVIAMEFGCRETETKKKKNRDIQTSALDYGNPVLHHKQTTNGFIALMSRESQKMYIPPF